MSEQRQALVAKKRIVVKVGSSTLTYATGKLNYHRIDRLARDFSFFWSRKCGYGTVRTNS